MTIDFLAVRRAVTADSRAAFTKIRSQHPDQIFYGYSILTDDDAMSVVPGAMTEKWLSDLLNRSRPKNAEERDYYRWSPNEWHGIDFDLSHGANELLNIKPRYDERDPAGFTNFVAEAFAAIILGLKDLDASGFFGSGTDRERIFVICTIGDSPSNVWLEDESARILNPKSVYDAFLQERMSLRQDYVYHRRNPSDLYQIFMRVLAKRTARPDQPLRRPDSHLSYLQRLCSFLPWVGKRWIHGRKQAHESDKSAPQEWGKLIAVNKECSDADAWDMAESPEPMFSEVAGFIGIRSLRLFGIACCKRISPLMTDEVCKEAVALAQLIVEGQGSPEDAKRLCYQLQEEYLAQSKRMSSDDKNAQVRLWCLGAAMNVVHDGGTSSNESSNQQGPADLYSVWRSAASAVSHYNVKRVGDHPPAPLFAEYRAQADLLRDIIGNPFRPIEFEPHWRTVRVVELARTIYEQKAFDRMSQIANELKKAGCTNKEILDHCRSSKPHVRGCLIIDLVLNRKDELSL